MDMRNLALRTVLFMSAAALFPISAQAADAADAAAAAPAGTIAEIIVTAQRREERMQDVPIAMEAVSGDTLQRAGVASLQSIQTMAPALQMGTVRHNVQPYMRGVGTQNTSPGEEGSVATYVDGVYINYLSAATFGLANVSRVEVLKGPQGTLFGRNATGGVIHVITKDPSFTPAMDLNVSYGNYQWSRGSVYVSAPIGDKFAIDLSLYAENQAQGFGHQLILFGTPVKGGEVNTRSETSARAKLLWTPTEGTRVLIAVDAGRKESDVGNARSALPGTVIQGGTPASGGPYDTLSTDPNNAIVTYKGASIKAEQELPFGKLGSLSAIRTYHELTVLDQDGSPKAIAFATGDNPTQTFQQEFTLQGGTDRFNWNSGLFFYRAAGGYQPFGFVSSTPSQNRVFYSNMITHSYAAYAQGVYSVTPTTKLTVGGRYTWDSRHVYGTTYATAGNTVPVGTVTLSANQHARYKDPTWRISLDQKVTPNVLVYVSQSRGFKAGIFSTNTYNLPAVAPETLDATEAGIKSTWFDRRLLVNASAFYYDYKNIQLSQTVQGATRIFNAARAKPRGIDVDIQALPPVPTGDLSLSGGFSILRAKYASFPGAPSLRPAPLSVGGNINNPPIDAKGNDMVRSPHFVSQASFDYAWPLASGEAGINGTWAYNSGFKFDPDNRIQQPAYSVVNAQIRFTKGDIEFYVFGQNLTDKRYLVAVSTSTLNSAASYGDPRTFGVGFRLSR
jgi:iron complex outermembrane receptor protein